MVSLWEIFCRHGIKKPAITDKNYSRFVEMTAEQRTVADLIIGKQVAIYSAAEQMDVDFTNTVDLLKVALKVLNFKVGPDFIDLIKRDDIVEVYSMEHIQLFSSFNFFNVCNYNLDDVLMYEWFKLYEREESVTSALLAEAFDHLSSARTISPFKTAKHIMRERFSEKQGVFEIGLKYISSAFTGPELRDGYLVSQEFRILDLVERNRVQILGAKSNQSFL